MVLLKQVLLGLLLKFVVSTIATNLFHNSYKDRFVLISEQVNDILQLCFRNHLNPLIITEQSSKYIFHKPMQISSSSIILINNDFKIQRNVKNSNPHVGTFVLTAVSDEQLNKALFKLQATPWWNTHSYFVLIGPSCTNMDHSQAGALNMLMMMWKRKTLSAVYLCYDVDAKAVMLYTFNPFTNYAPHPWKWVETIQDKPDQRWTLYEHQYQNGDKTFCPVIMFDKTLKIDDYVVPVIMDKDARQKNVPTGVPIRLNDYIPYIRQKRIAVTMNDVFSHMNVKINITNSDHLKHCLQTNNEKLIKKLENLLDNAFLLRPQPMYLGYQHVTYPDARVLMVLLGQNRPFLNTEAKIFSFFHPSILIPILIVFLMAVIILKVNQQEELISAWLQVWKLFLGSYIPKVPINTPARIFFIGVFWLVIILNGTFQSKLASFLTKPERIYVKTVEDAFRLQYDIYGPMEYMTGTGFLQLPAEQQKYLHLVETDMCLDRVLNNSQALCLTNPNYGTTNAKKHGLHISSPVLIFYTSYWVSPGFPLKKRIDTIILRLQVTGLTGRVLQQIFFDRLGYLNAHEHEETKFNRRPIELHDIFFIFKFLILGLVCSFIVFIIEIRRRRKVRLVLYCD